MNHIDKYDVIIAGCGLAGGTLALQLHKACPGLRILILERRSEPAPETIHKVGESTSELGSHYLRNVIGLTDHLESHHLPKFGFRFFLQTENLELHHQRIEIGSKINSPFPTHHIDRGILENYLCERIQLCGTELYYGAILKDASLINGKWQIQFEGNKELINCESTWFIDATGRNSFLKRKMNLGSSNEHLINSAWFRIDGTIDIQLWSVDQEWIMRADPGRRRLATNHLIGKGYWVWFIPLTNNKTSIGIVADPRFHPFENFNTLEKAFQWLQKNEPFAFSILNKFENSVCDFRVMKNFAYNHLQFYSAERWAVTGEAGAFLDAFYSPGTDLIAIGNSWITELIRKDFSGENIHLNTMIYDLAHRELIKGWINIYHNMYETFGNSRVFLLKIMWDWACYWSVPCVLYMNNGYSDISILKMYSDPSKGLGSRFAVLNDNMQQLFRYWNNFPSCECRDRFFNVFDCDFLKRFQIELSIPVPLEKLIGRVESNILLLEKIAAEIFRKVSCEINYTPEDMPVNPYSMMLHEGRDILISKSSEPGTFSCEEDIKNAVEMMWYEIETVKG